MSRCAIAAWCTARELCAPLRLCAALVIVSGWRVPWLARGVASIFFNGPYFILYVVTHGERVTGATRPGFPGVLITN